jgi:CO/xanthine dehydrogenase Mo-binding subunit
LSHLLQQQKARKDNYHPRIDAAERVSGRAKYGGDWKVPGMLYGRIVTSTVAHGDVTRVDASAAARNPDVKAIITCKDDTTVWSGGDMAHKRRLFVERIRYFGDCVGAVAATSRTAAREAASSLTVEVEELPAVFSIESAIGKGAAKVWDEGNLLGPTRYGFGDFESTFSKGDLVFEADYTTPRVSPAPLEPGVSLAWWDGDQLTVVAATQSIYGTRNGLAQDLGLPAGSVRVITKYKGGGFGGKGNVMNYDLIAALLAKKSGRPVMLEYSRSDDFVGTHTRWASMQHVRASVSRSDARLLAFDVKGYCEVGAYNRFRSGNFIQGPETYYSCEAWRAEVYGVYDHTLPTGFMRAPAGPHSCFAAESLVDDIASALAINPLEFRVRNAVVKPHNEGHFTSNGLKECLLEGAAAFGWKERWHPPGAGLGSGRDEKLTGVGMAMASWHAGLGMGEAIVSLRKDGTLEVNSGVVDIGTGAKSMMAVIASGILGIDLWRVSVVWGDTAKTVFARGEYGGSTTALTGTAVREASTRVRSRVLELASKKLGVPAARLRLEGGRVIVADGGRGLEVGEAIADSGQDSIEERVQTDPALPPHSERLSFTAHFAEVEVDPDTGQVEVTKYVAAQDCGEIVNRLTAESQIQGGVVMGLGAALSERVIVDQNFGSVQNPSFLTYRIQNAASVPRIDVIFTDTEDPYGPKSVGEISTVPVPAVIGNAIFNATKRRLRSIPFMPEEIARAMDAPLP